MIWINAITRAPAYGLTDAIDAQNDPGRPSSQPGPPSKTLHRNRSMDHRRDDGEPIFGLETRETLQSLSAEAAAQP